MPVRDTSRKSSATTPEGNAANRRAFWNRHPGLVWSNRNAPDDAFLSAALRKGRFLQLLDIAVEFGAARLRRQWEQEKECGDLSPGFIQRTEENLTIIEESYAKSVAARNGTSVEKT